MKRKQTDAKLNFLFVSVHLHIYSILFHLINLPLVDLVWIFGLLEKRLKNKQ